MRKLYAYVDESGDLGRGRGASRCITLAALLSGNAKAVERIPSRIRRRHLGNSLRQIPELKFSNSSCRIRKAVLSAVLAIPDCSVVSITLKKTFSSDVLQAKPQELYCRLASELAAGIVRGKRVGDLEMIFDARPEAKLLGQRMDDSIRRWISDECMATGRIAPAIKTSRFDSLNCPGIQTADFVAGAIQRRWEHGDASYYDLIAPRIALEVQLERHCKKWGSPWPGY